MDRVNLGCGTDYRTNWLNVDKQNACADVILDIEKTQLPQTDYIWVGNVLEHLAESGIVNIWHSLRNDVILEGEVPHYLSRHAYNDFTHLHYFNTQTFRQYPFTLFQIESLEVWYCFGKLLRFKLPLWCVGLHERLLPGILPPSHISFKLKKTGVEKR